MVLSCGVFALVLAIFGGCGAAPRPCPQFLPVAVKLDSPHQVRSPLSLKALVKVKDDNVITKNPESNLLISSSDLHLSQSKEVPSQKDEAIKPLLLNVSSPTLETTKDLRLKKRRRSRPKESKQLILNQNSLWSLKTINDKPAEEVLMTDKASVARDLKDSTESALVTVKKLN